jgi:hypothetical protein
MAYDFDLSERLPFGLGSAAAGVATAYSDSGVSYDVSIGGLPFFYAISDQQPYVRETNDYKRQQIDTSTEPGEQTLSQWWVRDQDSWHRGAGITFYEPGSNQETKYRFASGVGVDIWDQGNLRLLKKMDLAVTATGACYAGGGVVGGTSVTFTVAEGVLKRHDGATGTAYSCAATPATEPVLAGSTVLVGTTGGIYSGTASGSALTALWTSAGSVVRPWWVKNRIIASKDNALYEMTLAGGVLPAALYTHPDANFTWTAVAEAPDCILASGYSNGYGYVFAFNLVAGATAGSSPTLGSAIQVAEFPPGEEVYALKVYLGAFVAVGTKRGVRIGALGNNGRVSYGPLTIETTYPVRALGARGSYVYAGIQGDIDGGSGCARIDLGTEILTYTTTGYAQGSSRYAWAYDVQTKDTGVINSVAFLGNSERVVLASQAHGIYVQSATDYEATGYATSGRIRYATAEAKTFAQVKLRADVMDDTSVIISSIDSSDVERVVTTVTAGTDLNEDISLGAISEATQPYMSVKLTLARNTATITPIIESYQVKATPTPHIQRNIRMPLRLHDVERDRNGQEIGYRDSSWIRLAALESLENSRSVLSVTDNTNGETFSGQIKSVQFIRDTPPSRNEPNFGGLVVVTVLKL